jgi:hypothetical protein
MNPDKPLVVYIDVDDTLTRSAGTKVMPVRAVVEHAKELAKSGAAVYCWSTAGAEYARSTAQRLGIEDFQVHRRVLGWSIPDYQGSACDKTWAHTDKGRGFVTTLQHQIAKSPFDRFH